MFQVLSPRNNIRLVVLTLVGFLLATTTTTTYARNSLPRSGNSRRYASQASISSSSPSLSDQPPWNPSSLIDTDGFLKGLYTRCAGEWEREVRLRTAFGTDLPASVRQVPGDGNCLFHSLSLCLQHAQNGTHWDMGSRIDELYQHSQQLRKQAVACLRQGHKKLFLQGRETLRAHELVTAAAQQYDMSPEEYCTAMEEECVWGGGPEIVALCNLLKRPIHVYELAVQQPGDNKCKNNNNSNSNNINRQQRQRSQQQQPAFVLRRMACFGSPRFDGRQALHILSADSRFPDLTPGQQMSAGNHFLAVFPQSRTRRKRRRLRGGAAGWGRSKKERHGETANASTDRDLQHDDEQDEVPLPRRLVQWWRGLVQRLQ